MYNSTIVFQFSIDNAPPWSLHLRLPQPDFRTTLFANTHSSGHILYLLLEIKMTEEWNESLGTSQLCWKQTTTKKPMWLHGKPGSFNQGESEAQTSVSKRKYIMVVTRVSYTLSSFFWFRVQKISWRGSAGGRGKGFLYSVNLLSFTKEKSPFQCPCHLSKATQLKSR